MVGLLARDGVAAGLLASGLLYLLEAALDATWQTVS